MEIFRSFFSQEKKRTLYLSKLSSTIIIAKASIVYVRDINYYVHKEGSTNTTSLVVIRINRTTKFLTIQSPSWIQDIVKEIS